MATFNPTKDSVMDKIVADTNYGTAEDIYALINYAGGTKTSLYRAIGAFDLTGTTSASVKNARLVIVTNTYGILGWPFTVNIVRCTRTNWTEAGVTWNKYDGTNNWTNAGGDIDTADPPQIAYSPPNVGTGVTLYIPSMEGLVKDAINNRANILSIIIKLVDEDPGFTKDLQWASKNNATPSIRWYLETNFTEAVNKIRQLNQAVNRASTY